MIMVIMILIIVNSNKAVVFHTVFALLDFDEPYPLQIPVFLSGLILDSSRDYKTKLITVRTITIATNKPR